jgi:hypothetical protein
MAVGHTGQPLGFLEKRECQRRIVAAEGAHSLDVPSWAEWKGARQVIVIDHLWVEIEAMVIEWTSVCFS